MDSGTMSSAIGVCVPAAPRANAARGTDYGEYVHEILRHAGLNYATVSQEELAARLADLKVLVTVGEAGADASPGDSLRRWVEAGGAWISVGGTWGLQDLLGVQAEEATHAGWGAAVGTLGEGYLKGRLRSHPVVAPLTAPLHFFGGLAVRAAGGRVLAGVLDAHHRRAGRAGVVETRPGRGACLLIAPDLTGSVVRIQQGLPVMRDGVSAPDGTASVTDRVLKCDDGCVLDWIFDRDEVPEAPGLRAFLRPVADEWRDLLLRSIFYLARRRRVGVQVLWMYPRNLPAIAHLSHDSDGNDPEKARRLLERLRRADIRSTWCTLVPGYPPEVTGAIRAAGHELAMHYDAQSAGRTWGQEEFDSQWRELVRCFGGEKPRTNKNHYTRWQGDTELYDWCQGRGIELDQSKGPSKTGEAGFLFGTCQPYFPAAFDGRLLDVLELPFLTQDLVVFAPPVLTGHFLPAVLRHHGVYHLLFHPAHVDKPGMEEAFTGAILEARRQGLEWWTARQINDWERSRRQAQWAQYDARRRSIRLHAPSPLPQATVLWLDNFAGPATVNGQPLSTNTVRRWGFDFRHAILKESPGTP